MTDAYKGRRRPGENRRRLVEAGLVEFGLYGYHGTSTGRIAARADVPQPHLYANFSSKRAWLLACAEDSIERLCALTEASGASPEDLLLLVQLIAAMPDNEVGPAIAPLIHELSDLYGPTEFTLLTQLGVTALLAHGSDVSSAPAESSG